MERFPLYHETLRRMVLDASASFPDLTATPERSKRTSRSRFMIEEEERSCRRVEKKGWQEPNSWPGAKQSEQGESLAFSG
jgi:hypothetical protein